MELPRTDRRGDDVISPLNDDAGDMRDFVCVAQQLSVLFHKAGIDKVMRLDPCEGEGIIIAGKGVGTLR